MRSTSIAFVFLFALIAPFAAAQNFTGTWFTTRGVLELKGDAAALDGTYGDDRANTIHGTVKAKTLEFEATEGGAKVTGTLELDKSGHRFTGKWKSANGDGTWRGWRHDPATEKGKAPAIAGFWRTSWGMLELEQKGNKLTGGFGAQGWSTVEGEIVGRFVKLDYKSPFGGGAFTIDVDADGKNAFGSATGTRGGPWPLVLQRLDGHSRAVVPKAGAIVNGIAKNRLVYWLRAPKSWKQGQPLPLLVFLHGSNYASRPYVESIGVSELGERYFVVGIDGESWLDSSAPGDPRQNYTYVNFMGKSTYEGYPNTDRESPALVAELIGDLQKQLGSKRTFVGGHSQGGFLTWFLVMHFPELVSGVFPMSSGMVMQCEPDVFADEKLRQQQRNVAIAVVHAKNDPVVAFTQGEASWRSCLEQGFPALRLFTNDAAHMFAGLPWRDAVQWLDDTTSGDPATLLRVARDAVGAKRWRDAAAVVGRLRALKPVPAETAAIAASIDDAAKADATKFLALVKERGKGEWIDDFLAFRDEFEFADCSKELMKAFAALRAEHEAPAKQLIGEARALFQKGQRDAGWQKYGVVVTEWWASSSYPNVKRWLAERR